MTLHDDAEAARRKVYDDDRTNLLVERDTAQQDAARLTTLLDNANAQLAVADADVARLTADLTTVRTDLAAALAANASLTTEVTGLRSDVADLSAQCEALTQRVTDLLAQLQAQAPKAATVFGASDGDWPVQGVTNLAGLRCYLGGGALHSGTSWTTTAELVNALARVQDGGTVWLSIKDNRAADLARVVQQFHTVTEGRDLTLVVTYRHEPENDVKLALSDPAKQADVSAYQAAWANLLPAIQDNGALAATCLLGDRVSPSSPNNPESVAYHVKGVDLVGFDRYNPGLGNATSYTNPTTVLQAVTQYALNRSTEDGQTYALGIGEWGTIAVGSDANGAGGDQAGRRAWAKGYVERIRAIHADPDLPDVPVCLYWNQARMAFDTDPTGQLAQAALGL